MKYLTQAKLNVMKKVPYIRKTGEMKLSKDANAKVQYTFASEADLLDKLHPAMMEEGLVISPKRSAIKESMQYQSSTGGMTHRVQVEVTYELCHVGGESQEVSTVGEGCDYGDKAATKAMTAALKVALRQIFLIELGDEPENQTSEIHQQKSEPKQISTEEIVRIATHNIGVMKTTGQLIDCRDKYLSKNLPADAVMYLDNKLLEKMELLIRSLPNGDQLDIAVERLKGSESKKQFDGEGFARVGQAIKDKVAALVGTNGKEGSV